MHSIAVLERQTSHCIEIFSYVTLMRVGPNVSSYTRIQAVPYSNLGRKSDNKHRNLLLISTARPRRIRTHHHLRTFRLASYLTRGVITTLQ